MDSIIELLLGLAFVAVPVIFKWIGKSFEKAGGQPMPQDTVQDEFEQDFRAWLEEQPELTRPVEKVVEIKPKPKTITPVVKQEVEPTVKPAVKPAAKKEKIDPKKLVVYSEIMKPKYTE